jgi:molybdate transport system substrate-binding protein
MKLNPSSLLLLLILLLTGLLLASCQRATDTPTTITVAAASDLVPAFEELGREFERQTKVKVVFSFGSTGMLTQQIANGAPMDVFAAANVTYIEELEKNGLLAPGTKALYARGRITLWTNKDSPFKPAQVVDLARPEIKRIAIANPDHAPYGMAAREALQSAGIFEAVKGKLIYGENVRQALQFAQTGNTDVAVVALSLSVGSDGQWVLIPAELHKQLDQALAVIKSTRQLDAASKFALFVNSEQGTTIMRKYGFTKN